MFCVLARPKSHTTVALKKSVLQRSFSYHELEINVVISDTIEIVAGISGITAWVTVLNIFFLMVTNVLVRDTYLPSQKC